VAPAEARATQLDDGNDGSRDSCRDDDDDHVEPPEVGSGEALVVRWSSDCGAGAPLDG
jgi:hypothetical protein